MRTAAVWAFVFCLAGPAHGAEAEGQSSSENAKQLSGMSVLGNSEAPKSLVIVPWKSSEIGDGIGVSNMLDGRARPVDKEVFIRELDYYELRTGAGGLAGGTGQSALAAAEPD